MSYDSGSNYKYPKNEKSKPASSPTEADSVQKAADIEQDFKQLNIYLTDIYEHSVRQIKDAGNLWIQFSDKFNAFQKKILAGAGISPEKEQEEAKNIS